MSEPITEVILVVSAIIFGILLIILLIPKVAEPAFKTVSNENAFVLAEETSSLITALSLMDKGNVKKILPTEWDIVIKKTKKGVFIEFIKNDIKSSKIGNVPVFGYVKEVKLKSVSSIYLLKEMGEPVKVMKNG